MEKAICQACKKEKTGFIEHKIAEFETSRIICNDCHKVISWYSNELDDINAKSLAVIE